MPLKDLEILAKRGKKRKSKKKGAGASRSALLKVIMPHISGDHGDALAGALSNNDYSKFGQLWIDASKRILSAVKSNMGSETPQAITANSSGKTVHVIQDGADFYINEKGKKSYKLTWDKKVKDFDIEKAKEARKWLVEIMEKQGFKVIFDEE